MFKWKLITCLLVVFIGLQAQDPRTNTPASSAPWSRHFAGPAAALSQPATLGKWASTALTIVCQRPFLIDGLSDVQLFTAFPLGSKNGVSGGLRRFGSGNFSATSLSLGYGRSLSDHYQIGISFLWELSGAKGFSTERHLLPTISFQKTWEKASTGFFLQYGNSNSNNSAYTNWRFGTGIGKDWSEQLYTDFNICFSSIDGVSVNASLQYLLSAIRLVLQVQSRPYRYAFESGYEWNQFSLRVCSYWHPQIGWSPGLLIAWRRNDSTRKP